MDSFFLLLLFGIIVSLLPFSLCRADTDPVKAEEPEGEKRLGVKEKREKKGRKGRRSTGIVHLGEEVTHRHQHGRELPVHCHQDTEHHFLSVATCKG